MSTMDVSGLLCVLLLSSLCAHASAQVDTRGSECFFFSVSKILKVDGFKSCQQGKCLAAREGKTSSAEIELATLLLRGKTVTIKKGPLYIAMKKIAIIILDCFSFVRLKDEFWQAFPSLDGLMLPLMLENKLLCIADRR